MPIIYQTCTLSANVNVIGHEVIKQTDSNGNHGNHNSIGFADEWTPEIPFENVSLLGNTFGFI